MSTNEPHAATADPAAPTPPAPPSKWTLSRWLTIGGAAIVVVLLLLFYGIPFVHAAFTEESTDDAYVNGYPTFVASARLRPGHLGRSQGQQPRLQGAGDRQARPGAL